MIPPRNMGKVDDSFLVIFRDNTSLLNCRVYKKEFCWQVGKEERPGKVGKLVNNKSAQHFQAIFLSPWAVGKYLSSSSPPSVSGGKWCRTSQYQLLSSTFSEPYRFAEAKTVREGQHFSNSLRISSLGRCFTSSPREAILHPSTTGLGSPYNTAQLLVSFNSVLHRILQ